MEKDFLSVTAPVLHSFLVLAYEVEQSAHVALGLLRPSACLEGNTAHSERTQGFAADPVYGRAKCLPMLGSLKI